MRRLIFLSLLLAFAVRADPPRLLAVLEFENKLKAKDLQQIDARYLTDVVRSQALKAPDVRVMTRENMLVLLGTSGKTLSDCLGECEVDTGRKLGADLVISGELLRYGSAYKLSLKLHETHDGQLVSAVQASGADADALEKSLRSAVAELFAGASPPPAASVTRCEIALPAEGCPRHKEIAGTFDDPDTSSHVDQAHCLLRAAEWFGWCGDEHAVTARFYQGAQVVASKSTSAHCEITLPDEHCPLHENEPRGTFVDFEATAHSDPKRCLARASEWFGWCGIHSPVTARYLDGARQLATKVGNGHCEISLPEEGCPLHKEYSGTFVDGDVPAHGDQARCAGRAAQWTIWCGDKSPATSRYFEGAKLLVSTTGNSRCEIALAEEGCPRHPDFHGTFTDTVLESQGDQARCLLRAAEYYAWCGGSRPVSARWFDGGKWAGSKSAATRCEIALGSEGCPLHKEYSGTFTDSPDKSHHEAAGCLPRADEWAVWCKSTQAVEARFYEGAAVTARRSVSP